MDIYENKIVPQGIINIIERDEQGNITNTYQYKNAIMDYGRCILPFVLAGASGLPGNFPGRKVPVISKMKFGFGRPLGASSSQSTANRGIDYKFKNIIDPDSVLSQDINSLDIDSATSVVSVGSEIIAGRTEYIQSIPPYYIRLMSSLHKPFNFQLSELSPYNPEIIRGNISFDSRWVNVSRSAGLQEYDKGYQKDYPTPPSSAIGNSEYVWLGGNTTTSADDVTEDLESNVPQYGEMEWSVTFSSQLDASSRVVETRNNSQFVDDDGLTFEINEIGLFADFAPNDNYITLNNRSVPLNPMFAMRYIPTIIKRRSYSLEIQWTITF